MTKDLLIGERVAWYRRRRGMSQEVLAGLIGRTVDWLSKIENNKIKLDRLSVIRTLADVLDVSLGDLLTEPSLEDWIPDSGRRTVPVLRAALTDYRQITPLLASAIDVEPPDLDGVRREVSEIWDAYQESRYGFVTHRLPLLLAHAHVAAREYNGDQQLRAKALLAMTYQGAAMVLTKLGETDLGWIAAERGLNAAQESENELVIGSLFRSVTHCLLANNRFSAAVQLTEDAAAYLEPSLRSPSPAMLSIYGILFLAGSMAAARAKDRAAVRAFLKEATEAAQRIGTDANHMWTAFGPANVAIHRVATAAELGDFQVAIELGPRVETSGLPIERRVRHALEVARAYSMTSQTDRALEILLDAERVAPEQVRSLFLSRQLVLSWIRQQRNRPSFLLADLARRLGVV